MVGNFYKFAKYGRKFPVFYKIFNKNMLSKKTRYAFRALTHLAENYGKGPVLICNISEQKNIPLKFLENILNELKKADLLESKKGKEEAIF